MKLFLGFSYKAIKSSKKCGIKEKIQTFTIV